jgi:DNA-directed RNA polymerase specialized sigma24 family protein
MELVPCPGLSRRPPFPPGYPIAQVEPTSTPERPSFERIFAEYAPRVRAYFLRHGLSPSLADEVSQEVMLSVWSNTERFDPEKGE